MLGSLHCVVRHLSFDDARVESMAPGREKFEEEF
jgi:hypothetical protein